MKIFVIILILFSSISFGQSPDFFREDITFRIENRHFDVDGFYWFANNSDQPLVREIFYPFPNYSNEKIDSVRLFNISAGEKPNYKWDEKNGISFPLRIAPKDTVLMQIGYRQELFSDSAIYILKTTQTWGKPFMLAEYKLIIPDSISIKKFSYDPDRSYSIENKKIYYWKRESFMPDKDMIFLFPRCSKHYCQSEDSSHTIKYWAQAGLGLSSVKFTYSEAGISLAGGFALDYRGNLFSAKYHYESEISLFIEPAESFWGADLLYGRRINFRARALLVPFIPFGLPFKKLYNYTFTFSMGVGLVGGSRLKDRIYYEPFNSVYSTEQFSTVGLPIEAELIQQFSDNIGFGIGFYSNINKESRYYSIRSSLCIGLF